MRGFAVRDDAGQALGQGSWRAIVLAAPPQAPAEQSHCSWESQSDSSLAWGNNKGPGFAF